MNVKEVTDLELEEMTTELMLELGVPAHLKGYHYLRAAVRMAIKDFNIVSSVTKLLYPDVAHEFKTTDSKVERAIRNAVEVSWARGNDETQRKMFGFTREDNIRPTNSEYIARMADRIRMDIKALNKVG